MTAFPFMSALQALCLLVFLEPGQASRLLLSGGGGVPAEAPARTVVRPAKPSGKRVAVLGKSGLFLRPGARRPQPEEGEHFSKPHLSQWALLQEASADRSKTKTVASDASSANASYAEVANASFAEAEEDRFSEPALLQEVSEQRGTTKTAAAAASPANASFAEAEEEPSSEPHLPQWALLQEASEQRGTTKTAAAAASAANASFAEAEEEPSSLPHLPQWTLLQEASEERSTTKTAAAAASSTNMSSVEVVRASFVEAALPTVTFGTLVAEPLLETGADLAANSTARGPRDETLLDGFPMQPPGFASSWMGHDSKASGEHRAPEAPNLADLLPAADLFPPAAALLPAARSARSALWGLVGDVEDDVRPAFQSGLPDGHVSARRRFRVRLGLLLILAVAMYFAALVFSASLKYRMSHNSSPVTYYADPRFHDMSSEGHELEGFLDVFNASPRKVEMQVTGFVPSDSSGRYTVAWQGRQYRVAFNFSLDLSPWITHAGDVEGEDDTCGRAGDIEDGGDGATPTLWDGVVLDDLRKMRTFLEEEAAGKGNDLTIVRMEKSVDWPGWEDLVLNIKSRIRQSGFDGVVGIRKTEREEVQVYKNRPWANFMHSHTAKVLSTMSVIGGVAYYPYMWLFCKKIVVRSRFRVDVPIDSYWPLISDKLGAGGFVHDQRSSS